MVVLSKFNHDRDLEKTKGSKWSPGGLVQEGGMIGAWKDEDLDR